MSRKGFAVVCFVAALGGMPPIDSPASADDIIRSDTGTTKVSLRVQLERGLRAMRPQDFAFLNVVLAKVDDGTLPQSLVEQSFLWARHKRAYRVQYFEKVLRLLAQRQGVKFDTGNVSSFNPGFNSAITIQQSTPPVVNSQ